MNLNSLARNIFLSSLKSVNPAKLVENALHRHGDLLIVNGKEYLMKQNVVVVGFGKAVYGMAVGLQEKLKDHILRGYLSVPYGLDVPLLESLNNSKIQVMPAARNNLPDNAAVENALKIKETVDTLAPDDILLVLISGGGSALLPLPVPQISLADKLESIKIVANGGGTIQQLNTMRKKLSQTKGGRLISTCPSKNIISLIISDIVNDPLNLIASGPTVYDESSVSDVLKILCDLKVDKKIPAPVLEYLRSNVNDDTSTDNNDILRNSNLHNGSNVLIGSNKILVDSAYNIAKGHGYKPYIITTQLEGSASDIGIHLAEISMLFLESKSEKLLEHLNQLDESFTTENNIDEILNTDKICFITAGETTVQVRGNGVGGRNQHLIMSALTHLRKLALQNRNINLNNLCLLSGGSDGNDGPTDAAGAVCDGELVDYCIKENVDVEGFLENCGSYDFFTTYSSLNCLIKTGLTGTNVMDIQLVLIDVTSR